MFPGESYAKEWNGFSRGCLNARSRENRAEESRLDASFALQRVKSTRHETG
jgi:hypothetical protein